MEAPPLIGSVSPEPAPASPVPAWRSALMLVLMGAYPLVIGAVGFFHDDRPSGSAALPSTVKGLLLAGAENLGLFVLLFLIAAAVGRPGIRELHVLPGPGLRTWLFAAGYSVALRLGIAVLALGVVLLAGAVLSLQGGSLESLTAARPRVENLLDPRALRDPAYFLVSTTWISFIVAGFREELWRAMVFAGLLRWRPQWGNTLRGQLQVIGAAAVIFGLGHLSQGWAGVGLTAVLGAGLGAILRFHRSLWMAVLAHGFFDATSFVFLRLMDARGLLDQILGR